MAHPFTLVAEKRLKTVCLGEFKADAGDEPRNEPSKLVPTSTEIG